MLIFYTVLLLYNVYHSKFVSCSYNFSVNNNFLHLEDVSVHCNNESVDSYPYDQALKRCIMDSNCAYVRVDEYDVYNETHGNSKLCYSSNLSSLYPIHNGRVSIKVEKRGKNDLYNIKSNRRGICKSGQVIGQLEPVSSYYEAARECQRLNCDYFTISFYKDNNKNALETDNVSKINSAQFCVGDALGLYSEGHLMAERRRSK